MKEVKYFSPVTFKKFIWYTKNIVVISQILNKRVFGGQKVFKLPCNEQKYLIHQIIIMREITLQCVFCTSIYMPNVIVRNYKVPNYGSEGLESFFLTKTFITTLWFTEWFFNHELHVIIMIL